jgi:hypothetical protein
MQGGWWKGEYHRLVPLPALAGEAASRMATGRDSSDLHFDQDRFKCLTTQIFGEMFGVWKFHGLAGFA